MKILTSLFVSLLMFANLFAQKEQLKFIENKGQLRTTNGAIASDVLFYAESGNVRYAIRKDGISYVTSKTTGIIKEKKLDFSKTPANPIQKPAIPDSISICRIDMNWKNPESTTFAEGLDPLKHKFNYYDPFFPNGLIGIRSFEKVLIKNVYRNIDVLFYSSGAQLKYDYIINPGGDISQIQFEFAGVQNANLVGDTIILKSSMATIKDFIPRSDVIRNGVKENVRMSFKKTQKNSFGIRFNQSTAGFDKIIIDPAVWLTYLGGESIEYPYDVEGDKNGDLYIGGITYSTLFPISPGAFQTSFSGASSSASFLTKMDTYGGLLWSTFYGGSDYDLISGVCVDSLNYVYACGSASSLDLPVIASAYQPAIAGAYDAFVVKFDEFGIRIWDTYFGGSTMEAANKIDVDNNNNVWFTGYTQSTDYPLLNPYQPVFGGGAYDVLLTAFTPAGTLLYSTYYGGTDYEIGYDVDFTPGYIGITGIAVSNDYPLTIDAYDHLYAGAGEGFYTKFDIDGTMVYSTFLGGANYDQAYALEFDELGNSIVVGNTSSTVFPTTPGAFQTVYGGGAYDCFMVKHDSSNNVLWSTYYGNSYWEYGASVTTDENNNIYLFSEWEDDAFVAMPVLGCAFQKVFGGIEDEFIVKFSPDCEQECLTYLGGSMEDDAEGMGGIDYSNGFLYTACYSMGAYPITPGAYQSTVSGFMDMALARLCSVGCGDTSSTKASFTVDDTVCSAKPIQLIASSISCDLASIKYNWTFESGTPASSTLVNPIVSFNTVGSHLITLVVTSPCDSAIATFTITVVDHGLLSLTLSASTDTTCVGMPVTLNSVVGGGVAPYTYQWSTATSDTLDHVTISPTITGYTTFFAYDSSGCNSTQDSILITALAYPTVNSSADSCICPGKSIEITALSSDGYSWNTGQTSPSIVVSPTVQTTYIVTSSNGFCSSYDTTIICINPEATLTVSNDTVISGITSYEGVEVNLLATGDAPFQWSPSGGLSCTNCANPTANVLYTTTYTVTATNAFGCETSKMVTIYTEFELTIPNIITPNGDGINDKFNVFGLPPHSAITIFNRWGNLLFETVDYKNDWSTVSDGVYYYVISTLNGEKYSGFFHVSGN